jgi:hypothetical protein
VFISSASFDFPASTAPAGRIKHKAINREIPIFIYFLFIELYTSVLIYVLTDEYIKVLVFIEI